MCRVLLKIWLLALAPKMEVELFWKSSLNCLKLGNLFENWDLRNLPMVSQFAKLRTQRWHRDLYCLVQTSENNCFTYSIFFPNLAIFQKYVRDRSLRAAIGNSRPIKANMLLLREVAMVHEYKQEIPYFYYVLTFWSCSDSTHVHPFPLTASNRVGPEPVQNAPSELWYVMAGSESGWGLCGWMGALWLSFSAPKQGTLRCRLVKAGLLMRSKN